jgi:hypothetical protein
MAKAKSSSTLAARTKREAEAQFAELVAELKRLLVAFPHLSESFDDDELPVSFILKRGHDSAEAVVQKRRPKRGR